VVKSYSYYDWKLIDLLVEGKLALEMLPKTKIEWLLTVILPDGRTLASKLIETRDYRPIELFGKLLEVAGDKFSLIADIRGKTPLHISVGEGLTNVSQLILEALANRPLSDHICVMADLLPDLVSTVPFAICSYFDKRVIKCNWFEQQTQGTLKITEAE